MHDFSGKNILKIRKLFGFSQDDLKDIVGIKTRKTIANWEKGLGQPNVNQAFAIIVASGLTPEEFLSLIEIVDKTS